MVPVFLLLFLMDRSCLLVAVTLVVNTFVLVPPAAIAKSTAEIASITRAVTVEIRLQHNKTNGSGVIVHRQGDLYTLVTNRHVICGKGTCDRISASEIYNLKLADGQQYKVQSKAIKLLGSSPDNNLDLAIIQFRSSRNYKVVKIAEPGSLKIADKVYTAGFPLGQPGFNFYRGEAIAVVNKRLTIDSGGYTVIYSASTLPGMSGGGVFNNNGQLVAIHGRGDRYTNNTEIDDKSRVNSKIGYNRGIPIRWLVKSLAEVGINLGSGSISRIRASRQEIPASADEYFIAGFNKFVDPGDNIKAGKQQAIQDFSAAIRLNSQYAAAYFMRAYIYKELQNFQAALKDYDQSISLNPQFFEAYFNRAILKNDDLNDFSGALSDYNQAISIDPNFSATYNNRAILRSNQFNDLPGALNDYNRAISIDPQDSDLYYNRAILKDRKLNDVSGALEDYNQAIILNPKYAQAYGNRAILKAKKLRDRDGAIQDFRQAAQLFRERGDTESVARAIDALRQLGATE
jgi:S1-C subfamily serine protease/Tfp pilus assembly protein PilF